jgi:hypothetical protein
MKAKSIVIAAIGPLIALALFVARGLRRKQLIAGEVAALRDLGNSQRGATLDRSSGQDREPVERTSLNLQLALPAEERLGLATRWFSMEYREMLARRIVMLPR